MTSKAPAPAPDAERLPMPTRNPLPLSPTQEAQIRELYHERVRRKCSDEIKGTPGPGPQPMSREADLLLCTSLRRVRQGPHLHRRLLLPGPPPAHELVHEGPRHAGRAGRRAGGVV